MIIGTWLLELAVDRPRHRRQPRSRDHVAEAGVLQRHHALADDRRQHDLDRLGQQDDPHHLALAHADGEAASDWPAGPLGRRRGTPRPAPRRCRAISARPRTRTTPIAAVDAVERRRQIISSSDRDGAEELDHDPAGQPETAWSDSLPTPEHEAEARPRRRCRRPPSSVATRPSTRMART